MAKYKKSKGKGQTATRELAPVKPASKVRLCINCAQEGHYSRVCKYIPTWCDNCATFGHLPRFCREASGEYGDKDPAPRKSSTRGKAWREERDQEGSESSEGSEDEPKKSHKSKTRQTKALKAQLTAMARRYTPIEELDLDFGEEENDAY